MEQQKNLNDQEDLALQTSCVILVSGALTDIYIRNAARNDR